LLIYLGIYTVHCDRKSRVASAQSFTLWQQATIEMTRHNHSIVACLHLICTWVLFFAHIPFAVNSTFSAMPTERLQNCINQLWIFQVLGNLWIFMRETKISIICIKYSVDSRAIWNIHIIKKSGPKTDLRGTLQEVFAHW